MVKVSTKLHLVADEDSCLNKAADNEPVFLLRSSDKLAPIVVRIWARLAELHGSDVEEGKAGAAYATAIAMEKYAVEHCRGGKWPD